MCSGRLRSSVESTTKPKPPARTVQATVERMAEDLGRQALPPQNTINVQSADPGATITVPDGTTGVQAHST
jgi:hypothetical protein